MKSYSLLIIIIFASVISSYAQVPTQEQIEAANAKLDKVYQQVSNLMIYSQKQQLKQDQREWIKKRNQLKARNSQELIYFQTIERIAVLKEKLNQLVDPSSTKKFESDLKEVSLLDEKAWNLYKAGNYDNSLLLFKSSLSLNEKIVGPDDIGTASSIYGIARTYQSMKNNQKALPFFQRVLSTREKVLGQNDPETIKSLMDLGCAYIYVDEFDKAIQYLQKALTITENIFGKEHIKTAETLYTLASAYTTIDTKKELTLNERALAICEKKLGRENNFTAYCMINLAGGYCSLGNYDKALPMYEKALEILDEKLGKKDMHTLAALTNLAATYRNLKMYNKAVMLYNRAISIDETIKDDQNSLWSDLCALAETYRLMANYERALPLCERGVVICEKINGPQSPDTALALCHLAIIYQSIGNYKDALPLFERALTIQEKNQGHDGKTETLFNIAKTHYLAGSEPSGAREMLTKLWSERLADMKSALSMDERTRLSWQVSNLNYELISLLQSDQIAEIILATKGVVLDSRMADRVAAKSLNPDSRELRELQAAQCKIGKLAFSTAQEDRDEVERLKVRIDTIVRAQADQRIKIGLIRDFVTPSQIALSLPLRAFLIDFIQFTDPKIIGDKGRCYGALILSKDEDAKFVRIDDASLIDAAIHASRDAIAKGDEKALAEQQSIIAEKIWAPLAKCLPEGTKKLYIGADGQLNFLSFATLPAPDGGFLAEHYDIAYVGSGRDLARRGSPSDSKTVALFADPVFDRDAKSFSTNDLALRTGEVDAFGKIVFPLLPGTKVEAAAVEEVVKTGGWSPEARLGEAANKSAIMDLKSPGILHLATHGFYLNNLPSNGAEGERGMKVMQSADSSEPAPPPNIDPMHASGIALTGAQATIKAWGEGRVPDPSEDGILTAEEVGALNLDGTWIVTLSACDTGVGEAKSGEGVFGLRRAFMMAGAQNLLMTLWPVSDEMTPKIMADFYKEALTTHDAAGALANVQRDWLVKLRKEKGLLAAVRDAGPFAMVVMSNPNAKPLSEPASLKVSPAESPTPLTTPAPDCSKGSKVMPFSDALAKANAGDAYAQAVVAIYYALGYKTEKDLAVEAQ